MSSAMQRVLSGAEVRALSGRSDARGWVRLSIHLGLIVAAGWLVAVSGPWTIVPAMLALGVLQAALFAPLHETMHLTAFASRRTNAIVGWLVACPSLLNWHFYTAFHLAHHRHTQDPERDPELMPPPPGTLNGYVARIIALPYWRARARLVAACWRADLSAYSFVPEHAKTKIIRSVRLMSLLVAAMCGRLGAGVRLVGAVRVLARAATCWASRSCGCIC